MSRTSLALTLSQYSPSEQSESDRQDVASEDAPRTSSEHLPGEVRLLLKRHFDNMPSKMERVSGVAS